MASAAAKNIHVTLTAKWNQTSLIAEAAQAVGEFDSSMFWNFVDAVVPNNQKILTQKGQFEIATEALATVLDPHLHLLVDAELAARSFSPSVELHRQLARNEANPPPECQFSHFVHFSDGTTLCEEHAIAEKSMFLATNECNPSDHVSAAAYEFDFVHPKSPPSKVCAQAILYGVLGSEETKNLHLRLSSVAESVRYIFRHTTPFHENVEEMDEWSAPVALQGYGVSLDVKNMEYKAMDDKAAREDQQEEEQERHTGEPLTEIIAGVNIARLKQRRPELEEKIVDFAEDLISLQSKIVEDKEVELKVWELQSLGFQAAYDVVNSSNPLDTLMTTLNDFPLHVGRISKLKPPHFREFMENVSIFQQMMGEGESALYLNGIQVEKHKTDLFSLLESLHEEEATNLRLQGAIANEGGEKGSFNYDPATLFKGIEQLKSCPVMNQNTKSKAHRFFLPSSAIIWLNDVENDEMFGNLGDSLREVLQVNYYGQPRFPRRNLFNFVFVADPSQRDGLYVSYILSRLADQGMPVHLGIALTDLAAPKTFETSLDIDGNEIPILHQPTVASYVMAGFNFLLNKHPDEPFVAVRFLSRLYAVCRGPTLTMEELQIVAQEMIRSASLEELVAKATFLRKYDKAIKTFRNFNIKTLPVAFFNGLMFHENLDSALFMGFNSDFPQVKQWVKNKELLDSIDDLYEWIMVKSLAVKRYQPAVFGSLQLAPWHSKEHSQLIASRIWFFSPSYDYEVALLSHVLAVETNTVLGLRHLTSAASYFAECEGCTKSRFSVLQCGEDSPIKSIIETAITASSAMLERKRSTFLNIFLTHFVSYFQTDAELQDERIVGRALDETLAKLNSAQREAFENVLGSNLAETMHSLERNPEMCNILQKASGKGNFMHTNGRITLLDETFLTSDFGLLEGHEMERAEAVFKCVEALPFNELLTDLTGEDATSDFFSSKQLAIHSVLVDDLSRRGIRVSTAGFFPPAHAASNAFVVGDGKARHKIIAVIDPVSHVSQKLVALVKFLTTFLPISGAVYLNPPSTLSKVPIKNFYRFVSAPKVSFDASGHLTSPAAHFRHMPTKTLLTMGVDDPESWMVFATSAQHDLDNIMLDKLGKLTQTLHAEYTLESILVTGSCTDLTTEAPPRGLPLVMNLRKGDQDRQSGARDTLVMSNYGYFQLRGNPGLWHISIKKGRAESIYEVLGAYEQDSSFISGAEGTPHATVSSFTGKFVYLKVQKRQGKEGESILSSAPEDTDEEEEEPTPPEKEEAGGGFFSNLFGGGAEPKEEVHENVDKKKGRWPPSGPRANKPKRPTLNIFSVASGHLYERFMRLMMYTVSQTSIDKFGANTTRVKFWLIENFMSPKFKDFLPKLSATLGFEYELVSYRWPFWLRHQTEKQRIIWAYKILFLDVLFPLELEKVIFVDADQIILGDLHELYNLDLEGKPMAYTPFCIEARREETKGFRFWDSGYWIDHLRGKPYHISAIYVVDLKKLRQMAGGDQYRMVYDSLSADPNSLSNLDQDLPNFAQHQVPIFSLPEEWLWCETWCNDESKKKAKTIDLCNNPLTKTPKLENAKRIIPEWEAMDAMLEKLEYE